MTFLEKADKLPQNVHVFFFSNEPRLELERSCFMYGVADSDVAKISGPVGLIFVGDEKLENLPSIIAEELSLAGGMPFGIAYEINKRLFSRFSNHFQTSERLLREWEKLKSYPSLSEDEAWKKVLEIEPWLEEKEESEERPLLPKPIAAPKEALLLFEALKKYPRLTDQLITSSRIKIKTSPVPVMPTLKNWLTDYTFTLGPDYHSAVERGNYLFQSPNGRTLNLQDRDKLSYILKALDEKTPVEINGNTKQIVFFSAKSFRDNGSGNEKKIANPVNLLRDNKAINEQKNINFGNAVSNNSTVNLNPIAFEKNEFSETKTLSYPEKKPTIAFSFPQKMPFEKMKKQPDPQEVSAPAQPLRIFPISGKKNVPSAPNPLPKNVVNLKEQ